MLHMSKKADDTAKKVNESDSYISYMNKNIN